ncbi:MAG: DJ-1/PfpI family protein [Clostridia bacterium]|nr:DJ-1/PfpI family protein [Clostridia bacterium]
MIYEFLADGFEEVEALTPLDMLIRSGAEIKTVSITSSKEVVGAHGITVKADLTIDEVKEKPKLVILPGGIPGALNLRESKVVCNTVKDTYENGGFVAAICAAPFILGELGLLDGREAICYPGFEDRLYGAKISEKKVVSDGRIITAAGMGVAQEFGAELIAALFGEEKAKSVLRAILAT